MTTTRTEKPRPSRRTLIARAEKRNDQAKLRQYLGIPRTTKAVAA